MFNWRIFYKILLSLFCAYHLLVILVIPNGTSHLGRLLEPWIVSYASVLGMNTSWNLFSPDPAHTMYIKYTYYFRNELAQDIQDPEENFIPKTKDQSDGDLKDRRYLYAMRFMILNPQRLESILAPWLCLQRSQATHVRIEHIIEAIPPLDEATARGDQSVRDLGKSYEFINREFHCHGGQDELAQ